ncbi:MAG: hypothetical protein GY753_15680, partial [Gammaproteobacteria bacterium]|nr:hypothetical protein [Gammaproteobacteria bacterium]
ITDALDIQEGTNNYININTTDASENISFGNATTNPSYNFLGSGALSVAGAVGIGDPTPSSTLDVHGNLRVGVAYNNFAAPTNGAIIEGDVGIGTRSPSAQLHVIETTEQLRLGYDATNYTSFTVGIGGELTVDTVGNHIQLGTEYIYRDSGGGEVLSGTNFRSIQYPAGVSNNGGGNTGEIAVKVPWSTTWPTKGLARLQIKGWSYSTDALIDIEVWGYFYGSGSALYNDGWKNNGNVPITDVTYKSNGGDNYVVIDPAVASLGYESLWIEHAEVGGPGTIVDADIEGWDISLTDTTGWTIEDTFVAGHQDTLTDSLNSPIDDTVWLSWDGSQVSSAQLLSLNGGLTIQTGDTFTFNGDAFTDFTGGGLVENSGVLTVDTTTSGSGFFQDGGNSFGATAVLGTNDAQSLILEVGGVDALTIADGGATTFQNETDSTTGFVVNDADGGTPILNVDTINERVGIGTATPTETLDVNGRARVNGLILPFGTQSAGDSFIAGFTQNAITNYDLRGGIVGTSTTGTVNITGPERAVRNGSGGSAAVITGGASGGTVVYELTGVDLPTYANTYFQPYVQWRTGSEPTGVKVEFRDNSSLWNTHIDDTSAAWFGGLWYDTNDYQEDDWPVTGVRFTFTVDSGTTGYLSEIGVRNDNQPFGEFALASLSADNQFYRDTILGDSTADELTVNATIQGTNALIFEGSSADGFETTLQVVNPTADVIYQLADESAGTYELCSTANNCVGGGGGEAIGGSGTLNTIALFTPDGNNIGDSLLTQSGTTITADGSLTVADATTSADILTIGDAAVQGSDANDGRISLYGEQTGATMVATIANSGANLGISVGSGNVQFSGASNVDLLSGTNFRVRDAGDTDWVTFGHDGTDFNISGFNTTDININGSNLDLDTGGLEVNDVLVLTNAAALQNITGLNVDDVVLDINTGTNDGALLLTNSNDTTHQLAIGQYGGNTTQIRIVPKDTGVFQWGNDINYDFANTRWNFDGTHLFEDNTILGDANTDTLTINAGSDGSGISFGDDSFQSCVLETNGSGVVTCGTDGGDGVGIADLNGETGGTQSFADDTNVTISSATNTHTLGWSGQLSIARGGTGASSLNNLITLGTHTTGNYVSNVTGNAQIAVGGSAGEGWTPTLSIQGDSIGDTQLAFNTGQHLDTGASPSLTGLTISGLTNCDTIDTNGSGVLSCGTDAGAGGGLTSLNSETGVSQTFAAGTTNINFSSSSNVHTFTWTGDLAVADGGTGAGTFTSNGVILGNGTGALGVTAVGATGECLQGNTGSAPTWSACPGDGVGLSDLNG